jgi:type IV secretion system protein VirB6
MEWNFLSQLYQSLDVALMAAVNQILASIIAYIRPVIIACSALYVALSLIFDMMDFGGMANPGKVINYLLRAAIIVFAVSTVGVYNQYFTDPFLNFLPNELSNAIAGGTGAPVINAAAFDHLWTTAWAAGEVVEKAIPWYSFKGIFLSMVVIGYWGVSILAIGFAFLVYLGSHVLGELLIALGPIFVCCLLTPYTTKIFDAFVGALTSVVLLQLFVVALLGLAIVTVSHLLQTLAGVGVGVGGNLMSGVDAVLEGGFLMVCVAFLTFEVSKWAAHIGGGVAHGLSAYTAIASKTLQVAGAGAGAAAAAGAGGDVAAGAARGANIARAMIPAGRSLG